MRIRRQKFFIGDVVYTKRKGERKREGIISEALFDDGYWQYATTDEAWFDDEEITLIERASEKSLTKLSKLTEDY